jgi:hypothetical protein
MMTQKAIIRISDKKVYKKRFKIKRTVRDS